MFERLVTNDWQTEELLFTCHIHVVHSLGFRVYGKVLILIKPKLTELTQSCHREAVAAAHRVSRSADNITKCDTQCVIQCVNPSSDNAARLCHRSDKSDTMSPLRYVCHHKMTQKATWKTHLRAAFIAICQIKTVKGIEKWWWILPYLRSLCFIL